MKMAFRLNDTQLKHIAIVAMTIDQELPIHSKQDMAITGRDLIADFGIKPGPQLGDILDELERLIVAGNTVKELGDYLDKRKN